MITAVIQSIVQQGNSLMAIVIFSNIGQVNYTFGMSDTPISIQARIQSDLDNMNGLAYQLNNVQSLVGTQLQTSSAILTTLQGNIDTQNATASIATAPVTTGTNTVAA